MDLLHRIGKVDVVGVIGQQVRPIGVTGLVVGARPQVDNLLRIADSWYGRTLRGNGNSDQENRSLASRIRRRSVTARYFYLLLIGLLDDKPLPALPLLGETIAEQRLATVSDEIAALIRKVRSEPGPWQDEQ